MRQFSIIKKAVSEAEIRLNRSERFKAHRRKDMKKAGEYLNTEHLYVLQIGDQKTDVFETMTGREAKVRNSSFESDFIEALDDRKKAALERPRLRRFICVPKAPEPVQLRPVFAQ